MEIIILTFFCLVSSFHFSIGNRRIDWIMKKIQATSSQLGQLEYDVFQIEKEIDGKIKLAQQHLEADLKTYFASSYIQTEVNESVADFCRGQNVDDMLSGRLLEELNALRQSFHQFKVRFHDLSTDLRNVEHDKDYCLKETRKLYIERFAKIQNQQLVIFTGQKDINVSLSLLHNDLKNILKDASRENEERRRVEERLQQITQEQEDLENTTRQQIQNVVSKGNEDGRRVEERLKQITQEQEDLENITRQQIQNIVSKGNENGGRVDERLKQITQEQEDLENTTRQQIQNIVSKGNEDGRRVEERLKQITQEQEDLEKTTRQQIQNIVSKGNEGSNVLFKAYLSKETTFNKGDTIKFDNAVSNIGNGYNPHSGIFTAPVSGYYAFTVILGGRGGGLADFCIKNQDSVEAYIMIHSGWVTVTMSTTAHVRKGDHVYTMLCHHSGKHIRGWTLTQFSGYLLKAD